MKKLLLGLCIVAMIFGSVGCRQMNSVGEDLGELSSEVKRLRLLEIPLAFVPVLWPWLYPGVIDDVNRWFFDIDPEIVDED